MELLFNAKLDEPGAWPMDRKAAARGTSPPWTSGQGRWCSHRRWALGQLRGRFLAAGHLQEEGTEGNLTKASLGGGVAWFGRASTISDGGRWCFDGTTHNVMGGKTRCENET
jgi:hypothetical protein